MKQSQSGSITDDIEGIRLPSGYQLGQYTIEDVLAAGDFRISYYAWDNKHNRNVVIQEYFPKSLALRQPDHISVTSKELDRLNDYEFGLSEFLLEARLISQIRSPYLPAVVEYHEANGTGYLVSEFDDGKTLREVLDSAQQLLNEQDLRSIMLSGLQGLRELHARNLLHTNISPLNIFIRLQGHPIILGQGLARYRLAQYTKTYSVSLAPGYTPLEQYALDGNVGPWSDLYALGATLYECIAGVKPIDAPARHTAILRGELDPLTPAIEIGQGDFSNLLLSNIDWMLQPSIENRPSSADLMLGIVSYQNQTDNSKQQTSNSAVNQISQPVAAIPAAKAKTQDNSTQLETKLYKQKPSRKFLLMALGFIFVSFIIFVGIQIYQHERFIATTPVITIEEPVVPVLLDEPDNMQLLNNRNDQLKISEESDDERRGVYEKIYQEEEISRRTKEQLTQELAELEKQENLEKQKYQDELDAQIKELATQAGQALDQLNLINPAAKSASYYYNQILELDAQNLIAKQGLKNIGSRYYDIAAQAIEDKDIEKADLNLKHMLRFSAHDPRVDELLTQIVNLKTEQEIKLQQALAQKESSSTGTSSPTEPQLKNTTQPDKPTPDLKQTVAISVDPNKLISEPEPAKVIRPLSKYEKSNIYKQYDRGEYNTLLYNKLLLAANYNDGRAQYLLAEMFAAGRGVEQNFAESTFWLKRALDYVNQSAAAKHPWAEKALGVIYEKGWYVDSNPARAINWYRSAANKGYAPAQYRLGLNYAKGLGIKKDIDQGIFWLNKATKQGHLEAQAALSKLMSSAK